MTTFSGEDNERILFDFKCECSKCGAEGKLGLLKKDGMKPFNCPEGCGTVYVPWKYLGEWKLKEVVMPVSWRIWRKRL